MSGIRGRVSWALGDQIVSSATNFGMSFVVLRTASLDDFGVFSIAYAAFVLSIAASRALVGQPAASLLPRHEGPELSSLVRGSARFAVLLGASIAAVIVLIGAILGGDIRSSLWVLAASIPFLLLQDSLRFISFATSQPKNAFLMDLAWAIGQVLAIVAILSWTDKEVWLFVGGWAISGALVGVAAWWLMILRHHSGSLTPGWFERTRELGLRFLLEGALQAGAMQAVLLATAVIAGVAELGRLNGARTIFGPMTVMMLGAELFGISEGASLVERRDFAGLQTLVSRMGIVLAAAPGLFLAVVWLLPTEFMEGVAGSNWGEIRGLFWVIALVTALQGIAWAFRIGLRARADARASLTSQIKAGPLILLFGVLGAALSGAMGTLVGVAAATGISSIVFARAFKISNGSDLESKEVQAIHG